MKTVARSMKRYLSILWRPAASLLAMAAPVLAHAATFNDMFSNLENQFSGAGIFLYSIAILVGIALFVFGVIKLVGNRNSHDSKAVPVIMLLVGVGLMSLPFIISMATTSTFGSDTSQGLPTL